ncbi:AcrR family transcriptional regulator [Bacillus mesophilus]|uniref:TetR/AcrR family transcriptional regulator n=1 Tax=Bacillus mesophilus TaxID=1808955 RepID=A0A6M0Q9G9_9BACI|nr:TetR-like C-terminal domain-containing protein [Bacillus mesophilus]MBM7662360.1 AcrR family transcriptional regulator [Bacillus mesophilus]NEY73011.1 TetR/AcrR family transcriptional regulator [Bacillus mesophilus]
MSPRMGLDKVTIIEVAVELANNEGMEAVTLATLAKRLNIRTPSLYNHIEGLDDLRNKLALIGMNRLFHGLKAAIGNKTGDEAVHAMSIGYVQFSRQNPGLYELTLAAPNPENIEIQQAGKSIVELTIEVLQEYKLERENAIHAVRGLRSLLHGFASLEQKQAFGLPVNLDKSLHLLVNTFLAGLHSLK